MKKYGLQLLLAVLLVACGGNSSEPSSIVPSPPAAIISLNQTAVFKGLRNDYTITRNLAGYKVTNKSGGSTELASVVKIQFDDMRINLQIYDKAKSIATLDLRALIDLYIAFFNRVPDADGLEYWIDQFKAGMNLDQISQSFYTAALMYPAQTGYNITMTDGDFVKVIYKNVLGRSGAKAPPEEDVNYWVSELKNGRSKGNLIRIMLASARSFTGDPEWGWVPTLLDNKVAVGSYFAVQQGINYNTPEESISKTIAIVANITSTDISVAGSVINVWDRSLNSDGAVSTAYVVTTNTGEGTSFGFPGVLVKAGATASLVINLLPGYVNAQFEGCGAKMVLTSSGSTLFVTRAITDNCILTSTATKLPIYKVSVHSSGGIIQNFEGTETLTGKLMEIMSGDSIEMSLVPDLGYQLDGGTYEDIGSSFCPTKLIGNRTIRVTPSNDCKVNVNFVLNDYDSNGIPDKKEANFIVHSIEVAPKAMRESDLGKTDVLFTVAASGNQGKRADGTLVPIAKVAMRTFFSRSGTNSDVELVQLYDDGTHGDAKANDAIYTASFRPSSFKLDSHTFLQGRARNITSWVVLFDELGNDLRFDRPNLFSTEVVSTILKDSVPLIAPSVKVSNKVYRSANYIALVDPTYHRLPDDKWLTRNVAQYVSGTFDATLIFNYGATFGSNWSSLANVKRFAQGIGLSDEFDFSADYGLPGICGVINIGAPHLNGYVFNHELGHCWSAWLRRPELLLANGGTHWITSSETSIMGQSGISIDRSSGTWKKVFLGSNRTFSMLDLYLGGMADISEVPPMYYINDPAIADGPFTETPIPDSKVSYMTRADLVRVYGVRSPRYDGRKKSFRILPIVISSSPLNNSEHTLIELLLAHYAGNDPGSDSGGDSTPASLSVACRNRCTLSTNIGSPIVKFIQRRPQMQTTPVKRALPKIVTEQDIKLHYKLH